MGYDTTYTEYHLTARGWIEGAWAVDQPPTHSPPPPADRIETWLLKETTHDTYVSKPVQEWELLWASPHYLEEERRQLRAKVYNEIVTEPNRLIRIQRHFPS